MSAGPLRAPWRAVPSVFSLHHVLDAEGRMVCSALPVQAKLIASAPELRAMLQEIVEADRAATAELAKLAIDLSHPTCDLTTRAADLLERIDAELVLLRVSTTTTNRTT